MRSEWSCEHGCDMIRFGISWASSSQRGPLGTHSYILQAFTANTCQGFRPWEHIQGSEKANWSLYPGSCPQPMSWWIYTLAPSLLGWDNSGAYSTVAQRSPAGLSSNGEPTEVTCSITHLVSVSFLSPPHFFIPLSELLRINF